jgi:hypothetical protein
MAISARRSGEKELEGMKFRRGLVILMVGMLTVSTGCTPQEQTIFRMVTALMVICGPPDSANLFCGFITLPHL